MNQKILSYRKGLSKEEIKDKIPTMGQVIHNFPLFGKTVSFERISLPMTLKKTEDENQETFGFGALLSVSDRFCAKS